MCGTLYGSDHCKYSITFQIQQENDNRENRVNFCYFHFHFSGKMARLSSLSPSQSVSFRHGTNVEFNSPGFNQSTNGPLDPPPMEGYNLQAVGKTRDFSNPMYDAVQSGTTVDPTLGNGSGNFK